MLALDPLGPVLSDASSRGTRGEASAVDSFISLELFPQVLWYGRTHGADGISCSYPSVLFSSTVGGAKKRGVV